MILFLLVMILVPGYGTHFSSKSKVQIRTCNELYPVISFQHQPINTIIKSNETAVFDCQIIGGIAAQITWLKDGAIIRTNTWRKMLQNNSLFIKSSIDHHGSIEGSYQCSLNVLGIGALISRKASLKINTVPAAFIDRTIISVNVKGNVILPCQAQSALNVSWYKNGDTVNKGYLTERKNNFILHFNGDLEIVNVADNDYGNYTCFENGNKPLSFVELNRDKDRSTERMTFSKEPQNIQAKENDVAVFMCSVRTEGDLKITWMKNGTPLILSDRVKVIGICSLHIWRVSEKDAGTYGCKASASNLEILKEVSLEVLVSPRFLLKPNHTIIARINEDISLDCIVTGNPPPTLSWYKNSDLLYNSTYFEISNNGTLRILGLLPSDGGLYQCLAENNFFSDHIISRLIIKDATGFTSKENLIQHHFGASFYPQPSSIHINAFLIRSTSVGITWNLDIIQTEALNPLYLVEWQSNASNSRMSANTSALEITVTGLQPSSTYQFTVSIFQHSSYNICDSASINVTTLSRSLSYAMPQNISVEALDSKTVSISWELSQNFDETRVTGFELFCRREDQDDAPDLRKKIEGTRRSTELSGLQNGTTYLLKLVTLCLNEISPPSNWIRIVTMQNDLDESRQPARPTSLRSHSTSSTISLSWTPPADSKIKIRGYELSYGTGSPDSFSQVLDSRQRFHVIKNLRPSSEYVISLKAYNNVGRGIPIYNSIFTKEEAVSPGPLVPMTPPVGLQTKVVSSTIINLSWSDASFSRLQKLKGVSDGRTYIIRYNPKFLRPYKYLNITGLEANITDLRPDTEYEFNVKISKGSRFSGWSLSVTERTKEAAPSSPPRELSLGPAEKDSSNIILSWQAPRQTNGKITGYIVHYSREATTPDGEWYSETVKGEGTSVNIEGLSKGATFFFKVQAKNEGGLGPLSPTIMFTTEEEHSEPFEGPTLTSKEGAFSMWLMMSLIIGCVVLLTSVISTFAICKIKSKNKSTKHSNDTYSSPNLSSGKNSLKPPDLWTHGSGLNEFAEMPSCNQIDQISNDSYSVDRWTLKSSNIPVPKDDIKPCGSKKTMNQKLTETSSLLAGNVELKATSTHHHKSLCSSAPRVYVGDLVQSTLTSVNPNVEFPPSKGEINFPPPLPPLSSPRIILPSKHFTHDLFSQPEDDDKNSAEDLSKEMANIEGLMKDLNAISKQQRFEF